MGQAASRGAAQARGMSLFAFVMGDFLKPPVVEAVNLTGCLGRVGDLTRVNASDDFEVVAVAVMIRDAADAVLEQGPAALVAGLWNRRGC